MDNSTTVLPASVTQAPTEMWLAILLGLAWLVAAHYLNKRGFFLRGFISAAVLGLLFIVTLYIAYVWQSQQSLILLLVPPLVYIFNEYLLRRTNNLRDVIFISKLGLRYGDLFSARLGDLLKTDGLVLHRISIEDDNGQTLSLNEAVAKGPLAIVLVPTDDNDTTVANVKTAYSSHVPVVLVDKRIDDRLFEQLHITAPAYVGSDFEKGGAFAAEALAASIGGKGNIAIIAGPKDSAPSQARLRAFAVRTLERAPEIAVRYCTYCLSWDEDEGSSATMRLVRRFSDERIKLDGIFCCNDTLAMGAITALESAYEKGLLPRDSVRIVSYDGLPEMLEHIQSGRADATVDVQISTQATAVRQDNQNPCEYPQSHC
jgi:ABC-type sugar transport system substrate-binding protein